MGVVFIHFNLLEGLPVSNNVYGLNQPDWYFYLIQFFSNVVPRIAVPLFFLISGFLFFYHTEFDKHAYKRKLHTRAKTLLIPYILWNTIILLQKSARELPFLSSLAAPSQGTELHFSLVRLFNTFFNAGYPINVPMWYVRDLMVMVLMAPIIYWMIKRMGKWLIISIGIAKYFAIPMILPNSDYLPMFVTALFFFSWGAYYSINKQNFVETMRRYKYVPVMYLPIAIIDTLTKRAECNFYFHNLGILLGIVSAIIIASYLVEKEKVKVSPLLANASFFVYALHIIFLNPIGRGCIMAFHLPDNTLTMLILYLVVPIITIGLCLGIYKILKRYMPHICVLLTGGR